MTNYYGGAPIWEKALKTYWAKYRDKSGFRVTDDMLIKVYTADGLAYDILLYYFFYPYAEWSRIHKKIIPYVDGKVLDVGCGCGRIALYLQAKGYDVKGIDLSPAAVQICKERGFTNVEVANFLDYPTTERYDTILAVGSVIGEISQKTQTFKNIFSKLRQLLNPKGRVVGTMSYPLWGEPYVKVKGVDVFYERYWFEYMGERSQNPFIQFHVRPYDLATLFTNALYVEAVYEDIPDMQYERQNRGYSFSMRLR